MNGADSTTVSFQRFENEKLEPFDQEQPPPQYVFKRIRLNNGISKENFYSAQVSLATNMFGFFVAGSLQPLILLDKEYYNIDQDAAGRLTSLILVLQLVTKMLVSISYGHLSDKYGRRFMVRYGAISFFLSCIIVSTQRTIFPGFIIGKLLLANAGSAFASVPLTADYIHDDSKGKGIGISAFVFSISGLFANLYLKVLLYKDLSLGLCYFVTGTVVTLIIIVNSFGLKGGRYYLLGRAQNNEEGLRFKENFKEAMHVFKNNGWLIIALVLQVLGSSDFYIFFTFLLLYIKSLFPADVSDSEFNILTNNLQTLVIVPGIACNFLYGYFLDKKNKPLETAIVALAGGAFASLLTCFITQPYDWKIFVSAVLLGITIPGLFVISMYLSIKHFPADKRGIMIGFKGFMGHIGYFFIAIGGGFLYDYWRKDGPFIMCTTLLTFALIIILIINKKML